MLRFLSLLNICSEPSSFFLLTSVKLYPHFTVGLFLYRNQGTAFFGLLTGCFMAMIANHERAAMFRLRQEGIETKVIKEYRKSETTLASQALPPSNTKLLKQPIPALEGINKRSSTYTQ